MGTGPRFGVDQAGFRYGRSGDPVLRDVDLILDSRATVLIGPNGAGKSTLLRLLAGQLPLRHGRRIDDGRIGFAPQHPVRLDGFTVARQVRYAAWLAGIDRREIDGPAAQALTATGLSELADAPVSTLSGGQAARMGIAAALAGRPRFLLLDEPTAALDPLSRRAVNDVLAHLSRAGVGILASSHTAAEVRPPFSRLLVLDHGAVVFDDSVSAFLHGRHRTPLLAELAQALRDR